MTTQTDAATEARATFADLGVPPALARALEHEGMTSPFDIQAATIPDALAGKDVCGRAPTGSGKTIAFGVPLLALTPKADPHRPTALILSPTRELAQQIRMELLPLAQSSNRWVAAVYGGVPYNPQVRELQKGVDILVACPGRLLDLMNQGDIYLDDVQHVVVDEADRMADMGFLPDVKRILDETSDDRQTLLFSATLDGAVAELTKRYQKSPVRHEVGEVEPDVHAMDHHFWKIQHEDRVAHTSDAIKAAGPTIVFTRTRHGADRLSKQLSKTGVTSVAIHGGRSQGQRTRALDDFTHGRAQAMIATDVAARGIHVDGVACVVHFDPPEDDKTYLHRSGRTARAGATGVVVSFVRPNNRKPVQVLQRDLGLDVPIVDPAPASLGDGSLHRKPTKSATQTPQRPNGSKSRQRSRGDRRPERRPDERPRNNRSRNEATPRDDQHPVRDADGNLPRRVDNEGRPRRSGGSRTEGPGERSGKPRNGGQRGAKPAGNGQRSGKPKAAGSKPGGSTRRSGKPGGDTRRGGPKPVSKTHRKGGGAKSQARVNQRGS